MTDRTPSAAPAFLLHRGEAAELIRTRDWQRLAPGPPDRWPVPLQTIIDLMLGSKFPMFVAWGDALTFLYNDAYAAILGRKHPAAMGEPFKNVWSEIWPDILPLIERALAGEATYQVDMPLRMHRRGYDEATWFTFSYSPVRDVDGRLAGMYCACTETTANVLAERQRRAEIEQLRDMFEQAPGLMAVIRGSQHVFELANRAYTELVGGRDVIGLPVATALPEVISQGFVELLDRVFATGEPYIGRGVPVRLMRGSGELDERFVDFIFQPLRDASGRVTGIFIEGSDVTERIHMMRALQEEQQRKDEFLAMLAHELRNPLAPISHAAELLQRAPHDPALTRSASAIVARQAAHMARLVDDLLDVSRVTRGAIRLDRRPVQVAAIVDQAVELVADAVHARGHRLQVRRDGSDPAVHGDAPRLVQVVGNLLANAIRYTPDHGTIDVDISSDSATVRVSVTDNGIGIGAELIGHVFEPFTQAERSVDRSQGGLGLGLALVERLVALHGGSVSAHSPGPGLGSRFEIMLPRVTAAVASAPAAAAPASDGNRARRILVVDDNADAAHSLGLLLELLGHDVRVVLDAQVAFDDARAYRPEVLILDIGLPVMDGYALARRMRAEPALAGATLIALTGYGQPDDRERSAAAGFDHHLLKPVEVGTLVALLDCTPGQHAA